MLIAAGNSRDASLLPKVEALIADASPLVRAMAVWAMRQLAGEREGERLRSRHLAREGDTLGARRVAGGFGPMSRLFCLGLGYSALHLARRLTHKGWHVAGTARTPAGAAAIAAEGFTALVFDGSEPGAGLGEALQQATHVLVSVPPDETGDPALVHHADAIARRPGARLDRLSVDRRRLRRPRGRLGRRDDPDQSRLRSAAASVRAAEDAWLALGASAGKRVQVFRLAGIYGPGRSAIDRLRAGTAQRIVKPGQVFNRIHVEDIAEVLCAAIAGRGTHQIYNLADDEPAPAQDVIAYAAHLLHMPPAARDRFRGCRPLAYGKKLLCGEQAREQRAAAPRPRSRSQISELPPRVACHPRVRPQMNPRATVAPFRRGSTKPSLY